MANPVILLSNRLDKKDLPVLCGPATEATAIWLLWQKYFFVFNSIENLRCLLGELELILDSFALKSLFDHDEGNGLAVHLLLDHYFKSKKFIKFDETFFNFLIIKITLIRKNSKNFIF